MLAGVQDTDRLNAAQVGAVTQCVKKVKDTVAKLSSEHKELHSAVSKVGKAIDKVSPLNDVAQAGLIFISIFTFRSVPFRSFPFR